MMHPDPALETLPEAERFPVLSSRQEAFCRHYVATGNAAAAARQTGHALLQRPHIVGRVRQTRQLLSDPDIS